MPSDRLPPIPTRRLEPPLNLPLKVLLGLALTIGAVDVLYSLYAVVTFL